MLYDTYPHTLTHGIPLEVFIMVAEYLLDTDIKSTDNIFQLFHNRKTKMFLIITNKNGTNY